MLYKISLSIEINMLYSTHHCYKAHKSSDSVSLQRHYFGNFLRLQPFSGRIVHLLDLYNLRSKIIVNIDIKANYNIILDTIYLSGKTFISYLTLHCHKVHKSSDSVLSQIHYPCNFGHLQILNHIVHLFDQRNL